MTVGEVVGIGGWVVIGAASVAIGAVIADAADCPNHCCATVTFIGASAIGCEIVVDGAFASAIIATLIGKFL